MCREFWDRSGTVAGLSEAASSGGQYPSSQSSVPVTCIPHHLSHSSQSAMVGAAATHASMMPPASRVSVSSSHDERAVGLLSQLLRESCRLPEPAASDFMRLFTHELHSFPRTQTLPSVPHPDPMCVSDEAACGRLEARPSGLYPTPNGAGYAVTVSSTVGSGATPQQNVEAAPSKKAATPLSADVVGETYQPVAADSADQLSLLSCLQQLQQLYLESAASALQSLPVLQHYIVPTTSTSIVTDAVTSTTSAAGGTLGEIVYSQSSDPAQYV